VNNAAHEGKFPTGYGPTQGSVDQKGYGRCRGVEW
jgi:hypothetical protein